MASVMLKVLLGEAGAATHRLSSEHAAP